MDEKTLKAMMEPLSDEFPKGMEEVAELLAFLPEHMRLPIVQTMVGAFLFN